MIIKLRPQMCLMAEDIRKARRQFPTADFKIIEGDFGGYYFYAEGEHEQCL